MIQRVLKKKKCKVCKRKFQPISSLQIVDSPLCAIKWGQIKAEAAQRKKDKNRKRELKSKAQWLKEAQSAFNRWVRLRDYDEPCISCGRHHKGQYHAGHLYTVAARSDIRFHCDNVSKQCSACNNYLSGNQINYRRRLIKKIGLERVEALEVQGPALHLQVDDIVLIKDKFKKMANELQKAINER